MFFFFIGKVPMPEILRCSQNDSGRSFALLFELSADAMVCNNGYAVAQRGFTPLSF